MGANTGHAAQVVRLGEESGDAAAALIGRAFQDDPLFAHACPDPGERAHWLPWVWRWSVWKGFLFGQTLGTAGRFEGVATLFGPGGGEFTEQQLTGFGYRRGRAAIGPDAWDRAHQALNAAFDPAEEALHRAVPEPHWYLDAIAVDPTRQRTGIGSSLLRAANALADADRMPVALLTYQPGSLAFYWRHGYAVACEGTVPGSGLRWWGMRRDPPPRGAS